MREERKEGGRERGQGKEGRRGRKAALTVSSSSQMKRELQGLTN